jgi:hypothetical protein
MDLLFLVVLMNCLDPAADQEVNEFMSVRKRDF